MDRTNLAYRDCENGDTFSLAGRQTDMGYGINYLLKWATLAVNNRRLLDASMRWKEKREGHYDNIVNM